MTIVMVTHEPDMAAYADGVVHFMDGRIESDGRRKGELMIGKPSCSPCGRSAAMSCAPS